MAVGKYAVLTLGIDGDVTSELEFDSEQDAGEYANEVVHGWLGPEDREDRLRVLIVQEVYR